MRTDDIEAQDQQVATTVTATVLLEDDWSAEVEAIAAGWTIGPEFILARDERFDWRVAPWRNPG